jgi:ribonuclease HII
MSSKTYPTIELERQLVSEGPRFVIGIDEVGRGCVAGPVAVGAVLLDSASDSFNDPWPSKLRDSKLISESVRSDLIEPLNGWVAGHAVGMISAKKIDDLGIVECLAMAAGAALKHLLAEPGLRSQLATDGAVILLDGSHNWLGARAGGLSVIVRPKADRDCVSVAAASVFAKVERDELMQQLALAHPGFGFESNKGYASAGHIAALQALGPTSEHRVTWLRRILANPVA